MNFNKILLSFCSLIIYMFLFCSYNVNAQITSSGNNYSITSGNDLRDLIYESNSSYWNQKNITAPETININVNNNITIDNSLYYGLNSNMKNINIDFNNHTFFVKNNTGSSFVVNPDEKKNITVSNLNMGGDNITSNSVSNIPDPSGDGTTDGYYTTYYGILFQGDFNKSGSTNTSNSEVTYNNLNYNFPNDLGNNQPLSMYYLTLNFTGNNNITSKSTSQEFGENSNIKVSSGKTILKGGNTTGFTFGGGGGMFSPYYNQTNDNNFIISVAKNSDLNIINNSNSPMINFRNWSSRDKVQINNNGNLNITSNSSSPLFQKSYTNGISLNTGENAVTNIRSNNATPFNSLNSNSFKADLNKNSKTSLISTKNPFFSNDNWSNNISLDARAKLLTYSGSPTNNSSAGLINRLNNQNFNFNLIKPATAFGFSKDNLKNVTPENADSYDDKSINYNDYNLVEGLININNLINVGDQGMLIDDFPKVYLSSTEQNNTKINKSDNDTNDTLNKVARGDTDKDGDSLSFKTNLKLDSKSAAFNNFIFNQPIPSSMDNNTIEISKDGGNSYTKLKDYTNSEITDDNGKTKNLKLTDISGDYHNDKLSNQNIIIKGTLKGDSTYNTDNISTKSSLIGTGDFDDYRENSNLLNINYYGGAVQIKVNPMQFKNTNNIYTGKKIPLTTNNSGYDVNIEDNRSDKTGNVKLYIKADSNIFKNADNKQFTGDILYKNQSIYNNYVCIMDTNKPKSFNFTDFELNPFENETDSGDYKVDTSWKLVYS